MKFVLNKIGFIRSYNQWKREVSCINNLKIAWSETVLNSERLSICLSSLDLTVFFILVFLDLSNVFSIHKNTLCLLKILLHLSFFITCLNQNFWLLSNNLELRSLESMISQIFLIFFCILNEYWIVLLSIHFSLMMSLDEFVALSLDFIHLLS